MTGMLKAHIRKDSCLLVIQILTIGFKFDPSLVVTFFVILVASDGLNFIIHSRFSRSRQLGGHMPAFRLGVPPRYKANKL